MMPIAIPEWTPAGVLPAISTASPTSPERSPYRVRLADVVMRFGSSPERQLILSGYLEHRKALHDVGLTRGFQWLDGSFLEDVESTEGRPPRDIDVVTFFHVPSGQTSVSLASQHRHLFDPRATKRAFHVDAYFVQLDGEEPETLVNHSAYWYSMWSHRRSLEWKGYLQVDLAPADEELAQGSLGIPASQGDKP